MGIRTVLKERNLWQADFNLTQAKECLASQPDFSCGKIWLEEVLEIRGHKMLFLPKFHCELNWIEMVWANVKQELRRSCDYSITLLKLRFPVVLSSVQLPTASEYRDIVIVLCQVIDKDCKESCWITQFMKVYTSDRKIPMLVPQQLEHLKCAFKDKKPPKKQLQFM